MTVKPIRVVADEEDLPFEENRFDLVGEKKNVLIDDVG